MLRRRYSEAVTHEEKSSVRDIARQKRATGDYDVHRRLDAADGVTQHRIQKYRFKEAACPAMCSKLSDIMFIHSSTTRASP